MNILKVLLAGSLFLAGCSKTPTQTPAETIFPNSLKLMLMSGTTRTADCKVDHIFETSGRNIECVVIDFPEGMTDIDAKEQHALGLTRQYADAISAMGWRAEPLGDYIVNFEKPVSDECSTSLQLMTWVVDEAKPVKDRHFPSTRFTFIEKHEPACGADRFMP